MGLFSYECSKSEVSIPAYSQVDVDKKYSEVVLVTPNNRKIKGVYDGYGHIIDEKSDEEYDIFEEIIRDKYPETEKDLRDLFFENFNENSKLVKLVRKDQYNKETFNELKTSNDCQYQGFFYSDEYIENNFV